MAPTVSLSRHTLIVTNTLCTEIVNLVIVVIV